MTREHKLALVVGFGLVLFVGILIADHVAAEGRARPVPPAAAFEPSISDDLLRDVPFDIAAPKPVETLRAQANPPEHDSVIDMEPRQRGALARPTRLRNDRLRETRSPHEYRVRKGDTLGGIARRELGSESRWSELKELNDLRDSTIVPGQTLLIPDLNQGTRYRSEARVREVPSPPAQAPPVLRTYTVRSGDSLGRIARRELGSESRWPEIRDLNRMRDTTIVPGQELRLPGN